MGIEVDQISITHCTENLLIKNVSYVNTLERTAALIQMT
jgi:hypothetical protein